MAVRNTDPRDAKQRQYGVIAVAIAAIVALAVIALVVFGGLLGSSATPSPTPSSVVGASQTPRASVSAAPSSSSTARPPSASPGPTATPTARGSNVRPTTSISPGPTASDAALGDATPREAVFSLMGIDDLIAPEAIPRRITFNVEGKGDIHVDLTDITAGTVRMCLYPGDALVEPPDESCTVTDEGSLTATPTAPGPWTVWLFGDQPGRSPSATLRVRWAANTAALQMTNFRFQGTDSPNYTGFRVRVAPVADGQLHLAATWDDGQGGDYPYLIVLTDLDGSGEPPIFQDVGDHADAVREVVAQHNYEAAIDNTQDSVIDQVLLGATLTWP